MSDWQFSGQIERALKIPEKERLNDLARRIPSVGAWTTFEASVTDVQGELPCPSGFTPMHKKLSKR